MSTLRSLPGTGHRAFQCDVCDAVAAEQLVTRTTDSMGGLDILVNNAGIYKDHDILELSSVSYADWQQAWAETLQANLIGPANLCVREDHYPAASKRLPWLRVTR